MTTIEVTELPGRAKIHAELREAFRRRVVPAVAATVAVCVALGTGWRDSVQAGRTSKSAPVAHYLPWQGLYGPLPSQRVPVDLEHPYSAAAAVRTVSLPVCLASLAVGTGGTTGATAPVTLMAGVQPTGSLGTVIGSVATGAAAAVSSATTTPGGALAGPVSPPAADSVPLSGSPAGAPPPIAPTAFPPAPSAVPAFPTGQNPVIRSGALSGVGLPNTPLNGALSAIEQALGPSRIPVVPGFEPSSGGGAGSTSDGTGDGNSTVGPGDNRASGSSRGAGSAGGFAPLLDLNPLVTEGIVVDSCIPPGLEAGPFAPTGGTALQQRALSIAESQLGVPYAWGGTSPQGFDCSGLVQWSFIRAGIRLPRGAQDQYYAGPQVRPDQAVVPGDLVFFGNSPSEVEHVGIVAGDGWMLDAPHTGAVVRFDHIAGFGNVVGVTSPGA